MPTDLPPTAPDLSDPVQQAGYVDDAFATGDPDLVALALKEVATARRVPVALDENPPLSEVLRVLAELRIGLRAVPAGARNAPGADQNVPGQT